MNFIGHYLLIAVLFVAIDAVWLKSSQKFYSKYLGDIMAKKPDLKPASVFYVLYVGAVTFFALQPALASGRFAAALGHGAFLGLTMFATYDLTNQSTLKTWSPTVTVVDMAWGTFSTALVTVIAFMILH